MRASQTSPREAGGSADMLSDKRGRAGGPNKNINSNNRAAL